MVERRQWVVGQQQYGAEERRLLALPLSTTDDIERQSTHAAPPAAVTRTRCLSYQYHTIQPTSAASNTVTEHGPGCLLAKTRPEMAIEMSRDAPEWQLHIAASKMSTPLAHVNYFSHQYDATTWLRRY